MAASEGEGLPLYLKVVILLAGLVIGFVLVIDLLEFARVLA